MDPTPRPWTRDEYGHVKGPDGKSVCLARFALSSGRQPEESFANDALILAAVNSYSEAREAAFSKLAELLESAANMADSQGDFYAEIPVRTIREALKAAEDASK